MTPDALRAASNHVFYEVAMFRLAAAWLASDALCGPLHDAVLEAFVLHFRNLYVFYYQRIDSVRIRTAAAALGSGFEKQAVPAYRPGSDICAADFCASAETWQRVVIQPSTMLVADYIRAKKHVLHITVDRIRQVPDGTQQQPLLDEKRWAVGRTYREMSWLGATWLTHARPELLDDESKFYKLAVPFESLVNLDVEEWQQSGGQRDHLHGFDDVVS